MPVDWPTAGGATSESDTERDGFLSYSTEVHATIIGVGAGFATATADVPIVLAALILVAFGLTSIDRLNRKVAHEMRREPWYFTGFANATYGALKLVDVAAGLGVVL